MPDREKVINGLESLHGRLLGAAKRDSIAMLDAIIVSDALALLKVQEPEAMDAPKPDSDIGCWYDITHNYTLEQVISALKAQEPRVMTLDEVNRFVFGSPYIVETNIPGDEPRLMYGLYSHHGIAGNYTFDTVDRRRNLYDVDYARFWRCWTSRPTDEQREATPWN